MKCPLEDVKKAKVLLVFEEAHSLIPEWNSVASDGDKNATNGTAKVILQGRKYGLGSLVITQRTANVSKSILNQCNTIFALRVFDDTGKSFLENYIGKDYADTLATLDERHAIAIGKGLRLKQPVILRLNERTDVLAGAPAPPVAEAIPTPAIVTQVVV
jgi:DNA helicase HerA-like ATPase